ncbi:MAG: hypothetical protein CMJ31_04450 [Phycisphaerae bacterium]|nr:hypothetical protein [Phycisphaerae bacterium]
MATRRQPMLTEMTITAPADTDIPTASERSWHSGRAVAWSLAAFCAIVLVFSVRELASRIDAWQQANPKPLFYAIRTDHPTFSFSGREVSFEPEIDDSGAGTLILNYGDSSKELDIEVPQEHELPGLDRYYDWMHVLFFAENVDREPLDAFREKVEQRAIPLRCVVAVRRVDPGVPEDSRFQLEVEENDWGWGEVMRHRWSFTFYELLAEGGIEETTLRMPESGASFYRRRVRAQKDGEEMPERAPDELREGTWQWDVALRLMPRPPAITKENQALLNAGWTLPVTSASALGLVLSIAFACAPKRRGA